MKKLNYFLFFLLPLAFTSYAQEENSGITIRSGCRETHYYIDGVKVEVNKDTPNIISCQSLTQKSSSEDDFLSTRVFRLRDEKLDLAFHNAHTGNRVQLVLEIEDNEIKDFGYHNSTTNHPDLFETEKYFQYGEVEFLQRSGVLNSRELYELGFYYKSSLLKIHPYPQIINQ